MKHRSRIPIFEDAEREGQVYIQNDKVLILSIEQFEREEGKHFIKNTTSNVN